MKIKPTIRYFKEFKNSIPRTVFCPRHGAVTKYHTCKYRFPELFKPECLLDGVAKSAWVKVDETLRCHDCKGNVSCLNNLLHSN